MHLPPELAPSALNSIRYIMETDYPDSIKIKGIWTALLSHQSMVLGHMIKSRIGNNVFAGPFRGMELTQDVLASRYLPYLLGTYEWELQDTIEEVVKKPYKNIINIGCAFGYYAVGLARRMPAATVFAFDIDEQEVNKCKEMAKVNNVADRIRIGGRFEGEGFEKFEGETLVFMDIEGAEVELLDPVRYPALLKMDVIVELHDCNIDGLSTHLPLRFAETHNVKMIPNVPFNFPIDKILGTQYGMDHFDNLIATWEGRGGPTPFGVFTRK